MVVLGVHLIFPFFVRFGFADLILGGVVNVPVQLLRLDSNFFSTKFFFDAGDDGRRD